MTYIFIKYCLVGKKAALMFEMCELLELAGQGDLVFSYIVFIISILVAYIFGF